MNDQDQDIEVSEDDQTKEADSPAGDEESQEEEEEIEVTIGDKIEDQDDEEKKEGETRKYRDLRQRHRHLKKKYRQTLHELEQVKTPENAITDPGPKPKLDDTGIDYDTDIYDKKLAEWYDKKLKADEVKQRTTAKLEKEKAEQEKFQAAYHERKIKLKVKDFSDAEEEVVEQLDIAKQDIILRYAKRPELVVYALGKNPAKLASLAKLDPFQFAVELGKLEDSLKVGKRKPKTQPEKTIQSTGSLSGTVDRTLEKLREEAAKTGNMTKVMEYKRKKRKATG